MKIRNLLLLVTAVGGLTFGVTSLSAHCGSCGIGDSAKAEHSCPISCEKDCCAESGHALVGTVVSVDSEKRMVMVKHEGIPGVMDAMTMGCSVPEKFDLAGLTTGCQIRARLIDDNEEYLIKLIEVTDSAAS